MPDPMDFPKKALKNMMDGLCRDYTDQKHAFDDPDVQAAEKALDAAFLAKNVPGAFDAIEGYERAFRRFLCFLVGLACVLASVPAEAGDKKVGWIRQDPFRKGELQVMDSNGEKLYQVRENPFRRGEYEVRGQRGDVVTESDDGWLYGRE